MPKVITYHGIFYQKSNSRRRTCRTEQIPNLPQSHTPVRFSHRRQEIHLTHVMARKSQYQETPIKMASPTKSSSTGLVKMASISSVHLQPPKITRLTGSSTSGSPTTRSHHNRLNLISLSGKSRSPLPQRMDILPPTNTLQRNIKPQEIHIQHNMK